MRDEQLSQAATSRALQVAIDGPAGAGKSTVGRGLAEALGCRYLDTGLMYRAITWLALRSGTDLEDPASLKRLAGSTTFSLALDCETLKVNGTPAGESLRSPEVDRSVSVVSAHPEVREQMVGWQRELADRYCIVMVGRDIGTVVLPHAPVKLWVTASAQERARRRLAERILGSEQITENEMLGQILARDATDSGRAVAPLLKAPDAVEIPTDVLSPSDALRRAVDAVRHALNPATRTGIRDDSDRAGHMEE